ncbi:hypothetical protein EYF80_048062 [Liparis tanakae]|uniref:Uncharacterized protein n=1 Tax=Liparis tanakae TaxID=230148 RepID=A0A4Z2FL73_9TELE|nr:hypothetical protein EYF80_048062 [Liparis tanakae]
MAMEKEDNEMKEHCPWKAECGFDHWKQSAASPSIINPIGPLWDQSKGEEPVSLKNIRKLHENISKTPENIPKTSQLQC